MSINKIQITDFASVFGAFDEGPLALTAIISLLI